MLEQFLVRFVDIAKGELEPIFDLGVPPERRFVVPVVHHIGR